MNKIIHLFGLILLCGFVSTRFIELQTAVFCGERNIKLQCDATDKLIIVRAIFAPESDTCIVKDEFTNFSQASGCTQKDMTVEFKRQCNLLKSCVMNLNTMMIGDQCNDDEQNVVVKYKCIPLTTHVNINLV